MVFQPPFLQSAPVVRVSVMMTLSIAGPEPPWRSCWQKVSVVQELVATNV